MQNTQKACLPLAFPDQLDKDGTGAGASTQDQVEALQYWAGLMELMARLNVTQYNLFIRLFRDPSRPDVDSIRRLVHGAAINTIKSGPRAMEIVGDEISDPCSTREREVNYIPAGAGNTKGYVEVAQVTKAPCGTGIERNMVDREGGSMVAFGLCCMEDRPAIDNHFHLDRLW